MKRFLSLLLLAALAIAPGHAQVVIDWADVSKTGSSLADLTTRSAADLSSGTLPDARFPATLPAASGVNLTALNASNLASGTVPDARFPATLPALNGSALTALNASNISSGTLAAARLPSTITQATTFSAGLTASRINFGTDYGQPGAFDTASNGDRVIFLSSGPLSYDGRAGVGSASNLWFKSVSPSGDLGKIEFYTGSNTATPNFSFSGLGNFASAGNITAGAGLFVQARTVPGAGAGLEVYYAGSTSGLLSYDRSASEYRALAIDGSAQDFYISGSRKLGIDASGLTTVYGPGAFVSPSTSSSNPSILLGVDGVTSGYAVIKNANGATQANLYGDATYALRIDSTANGSPIRIDGSAFVVGSTDGLTIASYGSFASPALLIGDGAYGAYVSAGSLYFKSGSAYRFRNVADDGNLFTIDNTGNIAVIGTAASDSLGTGSATFGGGISVAQNAQIGGRGVIYGSVFVQTASDSSSGEPSAYDNRYATFGALGGGSAVYISYNQSTHLGYIGALEPGTSWRHLVLQPNPVNGYVGIGTGATAPTEKLTVAGNQILSGFLKIGGSSADWSGIQRASLPTGSQGLHITGATGYTYGISDPLPADSRAGAYISLKGGALADSYSGTIKLGAYGNATNGNLIVFTRRTGTDTEAESGRFDAAGNFVLQATLSTAAPSGGSAAAWKLGEETTIGTADVGLRVQVGASTYLIAADKL